MDNKNIFNKLPSIVWIATHSRNDVLASLLVCFLSYYLASYCLASAASAASAPIIEFVEHPLKLLNNEMQLQLQEQ